MPKTYLSSAPIEQCVLAFHLHRRIIYRLCGVFSISKSRRSKLTTTPLPYDAENPGRSRNKAVLKARVPCTHDAESRWSSEEPITRPSQTPCGEHDHVPLRVILRLCTPCVFFFHLLPFTIYCCRASSSMPPAVKLPLHLGFRSFLERPKPQKRFILHTRLTFQSVLHLRSRSTYRR